MTLACDYTCTSLNSVPLIGPSHIHTIVHGYSVLAITNNGVKKIWVLSWNHHYCRWNCSCFFNKVDCYFLKIHPCVIHQHKFENTSSVSVVRNSRNLSITQLRGDLCDPNPLSSQISNIKARVVGIERLWLLSKRSRSHWAHKIWSEWNTENFVRCWSCK